MSNPEVGTGTHTIRVDKRNGPDGARRKPMDFETSGSFRLSGRRFLLPKEMQVLRAVSTAAAFEFTVTWDSMWWADVVNRWYTRIVPDRTHVIFE